MITPIEHKNNGDQAIVKVIALCSGTALNSAGFSLRVLGANSYECTHV